MPRVLDADAVERLLPPPLARDSQRRAFLALASGEALLPPRLLVPGRGEDVAFCYAARLSPTGPAVSKFGSVNPGNAALGLPAVNAVVCVLDPVTGVPRVVIDGTSLTTVRTAAASAVAVDELAPGDAATLAVVGTGVQARAHIRALADVRAWSEVLVVGRDADRTGRLCADARADIVAATGRAVEVRQASADEAATAQVVALTTTSSTPVIDVSLLRPGATVVSIGSFTPDRREVPGSFLGSARVVVDDADSCVSDCGPVVDALGTGVVARADIATLGEVLSGKAPGRRADDEIVVYLSVGVGVQDAAAAETLLALLDAE